MKLEVGMYVRTLNGMIAKIISKKDVSGSLHREEIVYILDNGNRLALHSKKVVKSSHNIIDLIEPEDYVNGVEVIDKEFDNFNEEYLQCGVGDYIICTYEVKDIKSIITKEKMEQMNYKVGE